MWPAAQAKKRHLSPKPVDLQKFIAGLAAPDIKDAVVKQIELPIGSPKPWKEAHPLLARVFDRAIKVTSQIPAGDGHRQDPARLSRLRLSSKQAVPSHPCRGCCTRR